MGRTKPKTGVRKLLCLGPRTGFVYQVEDFPEIGTVVVRAPNGSALVQFLRAAVREPGKAGLVFQNANGDPRMVELIRRDFGMEPRPLAAVPNPETGSGKREAGSSEPKDSGSAANATAAKAAKSAAPVAGRSTP